MSLTHNLDITPRTWHISKAIKSFNVSPDNQYIAICDHSDTVSLWNQTGDELEFLWDFQADQKWMCTVTFSQDGTTLVTSGYDEIKVWDLATKTLYKELKARKPYSNLNLYNTTGISEQDIYNLKFLGAISIDPELLSEK